MKNRKKVLIIAYAYEPGKTSEPGVGWHFTHEIAKFMDVTVLTRLNNKEAIETIRDDSKIDYYYYDLPEIFLKIKKSIPLGIQLYFTQWQKGAYKEVEKILEVKHFDVLHHLTFGMTKMVPPVYKFDLPFIWGPIGGGDKIPFRFLKKMGLRSVIDEVIYRSVHKISDVSPLSEKTRKKASVILFRTFSSMTTFPKSGSPKRQVISESAMPKYQTVKYKDKKNDDLRILCIGRMIHGKGYEYALKGFQSFLGKGGQGKLFFLGNGPEKEKLQSYVASNNLTGKVFFKGFVAHDEVKSELERSHVLLHPSFREGGSWSIMESMYYGLPVICLNTSGPKDMVGDTGILIDLTTPEQVVEDISEGLMSLNRNEKLYKTLSLRSYQRIGQEYNWHKRGEQIKKVYQEVLQTTL